MSSAPNADEIIVDQTRYRMSISGDRERLKRSFISIFTDHPIVTLLVAMLIGALVFGDSPN